MNEATGTNAATSSSRQRRWRVGDLAAATGLTVRALHHYEQIGLLAPPSRAEGHQRLYSERDVRRLYRICALREIGLSLADLRRVEDRTSLRDVLRDHLAQVDAEIAELAQLRLLIAHACAQENVGADDLLATIEAMTLVARRGEARLASNKDNVRGRETDRGRSRSSPRATARSSERRPRGRSRPAGGVASGDGTKSTSRLRRPRVRSGAPRCVREAKQRPARNVGARSLVRIERRVPSGRRMLPIAMREPRHQRSRHGEDAQSSRGGLQESEEGGLPAGWRVPGAPVSLHPRAVRSRLRGECRLAEGRRRATTGMTRDG